jgi:uncharacterized membrane protein
MKLIAVQIFDKPEGSEYDIGYVSAEDQAKMAYKEIEEKVKEGKIQVESATIAIKDGDGNVKLRKTTEMTAGRGARRGALGGLLVGTVLGGPIGGLLAGLGLGAFLGGKGDKGIDRDFMKQISGRMVPGNAALFMLIPEDDEDTLKFLEAYEGPLYTTPLTDDVEEALDKASTHEDVVEAIKYDELG